MASVQQMLASTGNLQQNAQAALPVIPNNGNPAGAYNMPPTEQTPPKPAGPDLSWLQPSMAMQEVNATLQALQKNIDATRQQVQMPAQVATQQQQMQLPVIPQMNAYGPAPAPSGVVLPQMR